MKTLLFLLILTGPVSASVDHAVSMVPKGKLFDFINRDFDIRTKAGTTIEIEFGRDGKLKQASGKNLNKGDELEPGEGLISLSTIAQKLGTSGSKPEGYWLLEEDPELGWIYEIDNKLISAKSGKLLRTLETKASQNLSSFEL